MILPCQSEERSCGRYRVKPAKPDADYRCRWRREVDAGLRDAEWVAENRCEELAAKREGFEEVEG